MVFRPLFLVYRPLCKKPIITRERVPPATPKTHIRRSLRAMYSEQHHTTTTHSSIAVSLSCSINVAAHCQACTAAQPGGCSGLCQASARAHNHQIDAPSASVIEYSKQSACAMEQLRRPACRWPGSGSTPNVLYVCCCKELCGNGIIECMAKVRLID